MGKAKLVALAAVAAALVVGGVAWATIPDSSGVVHTCFKSGSWRVIDTSAESCKPGETPLAIDPGAVHAVIRTETQTIAPDSSHTFTAHCNAGEVATGGGWRLVGSLPGGDPVITTLGAIPTSSSTEPSAGETPIGWKVLGAVNHDTVDHDVTVFAVCAPASPAP
jgi:hypothetical protein